MARTPRLMPHKGHGHFTPYTGDVPDNGAMDGRVARDREAARHIHETDDLVWHGGIFIAGRLLPLMEEDVVYAGPQGCGRAYSRAVGPKGESEFVIYYPIGFGQWRAATNLIDLDEARILVDNFTGILSGIEAQNAAGAERRRTAWEVVERLTAPSNDSGRELG